MFVDICGWGHFVLRGPFGLGFQEAKLARDLGLSWGSCEFARYGFLISDGSLGAIKSRTGMRDVIAKPREQVAWPPKCSKHYKTFLIPDS